MQGKLNLIEETLDLALYMLEGGKLTGEEYSKIVSALESDYKSLIFGEGERNAGQLIEFLLLKGAKD